MLVRTDAFSITRALLTQGKVCIDQAERQEKSRQVRTMDIIYALARKVHVWLGPATDEEIDSVWPMFRTGDPEPGFSFMDEAYVTIFHQTIDRKVWSRCSDETTSFSLCVKKFFHRAWFTRR